MITPYGRYRWNRLPFGLKVSSEIFQKRLHAALSNLNGVFAIADDIIVLGCGNTYQEAILNHDENLKNLCERCQLKNIILNDDKAILKQTELVLMGHVISDQGVRPDPAKVEAIVKMPSPTDVSNPCVYICVTCCVRLSVTVTSCFFLPMFETRAHRYLFCFLI